jgi:hypothetical protein
MTVKHLFYHRRCKDNNSQAVALYVDGVLNNSAITPTSASRPIMTFRSGSAGAAGFAVSGVRDFSQHSDAPGAASRAGTDGKRNRSRHQQRHSSCRTPCGNAVGAGDRSSGAPYDSTSRSELRSWPSSGLFGPPLFRPLKKQIRRKTIEPEQTAAIPLATRT